MQIFSGGRQEMLFEAARLKCDKAGRRTAILDFAVNLTDENAQLPEFLRHAYANVADPDNAIEQAKLAKQVECQNIKLYELPDSKRAQMEFKALDLFDVTLDRDSDVGSQVVMRFSIATELGPVAGAWIVKAFGTSVFAAFEEGQANIPMPGVEEGAKPN